MMVRPMINFCLSLLVAVLLSVHLRVPLALFQMVRRAQADFDGQIYQSDSCRSRFEVDNTRIFTFSEQQDIPCYFERIDFGTVDTRGFWPKSVCALLNKVHGTLPSSGEQRCDFQ